jgi:hypothetical protein
MLVAPTEPNYRVETAWAVARRLAAVVLKHTAGEPVQARAMLGAAITDRRVTNHPRPVAMLIRGVVEKRNPRPTGEVGPHHNNSTYWRSNTDRIAHHRRDCAAYFHSGVIARQNPFFREPPRYFGDVHHELTTGPWRIVQNEYAEAIDSPHCAAGRCDAGCRAGSGGAARSRTRHDRVQLAWIDLGEHGFGKRDDRLRPAHASGRRCELVAQQGSPSLATSSEPPLHLRRTVRSRRSKSIFSPPR